MKNLSKLWGIVFLTAITFAFFSCEQPTNKPKVVEKPTAAPAGGNYTSVQTVTLVSTTEGAAIRYTLDGTTPTASSTLYSSAIAINETTTLKAVAIKEGWTNSEILIETYTITLPEKAIQPTATPTGGDYATAQTVTLTSATTGADIHYTLDGTTPTASSTKYSSPITISTTTTLKAVAVKSGMTNSDILTEAYIINDNGNVTGPSFPSNFRKAWIRDNFSNTLTFTSTTLKASNQSSTWNLTDVSGDSYTIATGTTSGAITIKLVNGNLEISGDSGTGENNWNGTWKPQPSFPSGFEGTWIRDNYNNTLTFTSTTLKSSSQNYTWNLAAVSGDSYTYTTSTTRLAITIKLINGNLEISGDSGTSENNWNGTWKPQNVPTNTVNNPADLPINIDLGTMTATDSGWRQLLDDIRTAGKYVNLDLSLCTMNGTSFNPDASVATGKDRIVSLVMPNVATSIEAGVLLGDSTFKNFTNLKSISGANIITIGEYAFYSSSSTTGNKSLQSVDFPQAQTIGNTVFAYCTSLQSVSLPQATSIGYSAFSGCTSLQSVSFPASVTLSTVNPTFTGCTSLTSFTLSGTGNLSVIENGRALVRDGTVLIAYPTASGTITMNTITSIFNSAFRGCTGLQSVNFPLVTSIGDYAFCDCTALQSVAFSQATSIGIEAFMYTTLQNASFPQVTSIGGMAFYRCTGLQNLDIPKVTSIGMFTFGYTGTATLSITMGLTAPTLNSEIFTGVTSAKTVTVKVPSGATGYTPLTGSTVTISGTNTDENWANGLRGGGGGSYSSFNQSYINQNITLIIEQQQ